MCELLTQLTFIHNEKHFSQLELWTSI